MRRLRSIALTLAAVLSLALVIASALAVVRGGPPDLTLVERVLDPRTDGEKAVEAAQRRLAKTPDDPRALAGLASAFIVRQRETADPIYYSKAGELIARATAGEVKDASVAITAAALANARHDFEIGLRWAELAVRLAPASAVARGVLTDSLVELGRYEEAIAAAQQMVDIRPDLASLARISYLRELHGDVEGAIVAMRRALDASAPRGEGPAWTEVQLGNLYFARGDLASAKAAYENALRRFDGYVYALGGLAKVRAAEGDAAGAIALYERASARLPVPELVAAVGDLRASVGDRAGAEREYAVVNAIDRLLVANGVRTDVDISLFSSDRGREAERAMTAARGEYARRPESIHVAQTLAWAEYRAGNLTAALRLSREALRLGTRDPLILYRAGVIAQDAGELDRARELLSLSAVANPRASLLFTDDLALRLRELTAAAR